MSAAADMSADQDTEDPAARGTAAARLSGVLGRIRAAHGYHAIADVDAARALRWAQRADRERSAGVRAGRLHGLPLAVKANIHTGDYRATAGTAALWENRPAHVAESVGRLRAAGAIIVATTTMHELAMGWTGNNPLYGQSLNPADPARSAGGSSGGSAAAVAARLVPAALGTDTNGSVRIPAAFCGVVGFRPTHGRYPGDGTVPLAPSLDTIGTFARSVSDIALLDAVLAGEPGAPLLTARLPRRVGIIPSHFDGDLHPEVRAAFDRVLRALAGAGTAVIELRPAELPRLLAGTAPAIIRQESVPALTEYLGRFAPQVTLGALRAAAGSDLAGALQEPTARSRAAYRSAMERRRMLRAVLADVFAAHGLDAILHAPAAMPAPPAAQPLVSPAPPVEIGGRIVPASSAYGRNAALASVGGLPGIVLPVGVTADGLPLAVELNGPRGADRRLLAVAAAVEQLAASS
ncbi:MAG TPA: amidase family protein [Trebonia sp.]|nr:amidase family protein [Trebonia sp.]